MKSCVALRHVAFEDLGTWRLVFEQRGFELTYIDAGVDKLEEATILGADLLVVLGGPIGVYEADRYPFLLDEMDLIGCRIGMLRPTLGICLGAQLMAKALGAAVAPGPAKEIGWAPVALTNAGRASPLRHLENVSVLHWHGDNFELPPGCLNLAATPHCPFQAFSKEANVLGLQFHVEAEAARIETWLVGHAVELSNAKIDAGAIRRDTLRYGRSLQDVSEKVLNEWLDHASL